MKPDTITKLPLEHQVEATIRRTAKEVEPDAAAHILARLAVERAAFLVGGSRAAAIAYVSEILGEMSLSTAVPRQHVLDSAESGSPKSQQRSRRTEQDIVVR